MQITRFILVMVSLLAVNVSNAAASEAGKEVDRATINPERIAYWLSKRDPQRFENNAFGLKEATNQYIESYQRSNKRNLVNRARTLSGKSSLRFDKNMRRANGINQSQANVLAILIDFPDLPHEAPRISANDTDMYYSDYPKSHYVEMLFSNSGFTGPNNKKHRSVRQYFAKESGDSFDFSGQFSGWFTANNNAQYYGRNTAQSSDQNVEQLVIEAVTKAVAAGLDLAEFDSDQNGVVDHILIFHSSIGEEAGGGVLGEDAIWSHSFSVVNINNGQPKDIAGSSVAIANYTIQPIDAAPGVVAHEFGHDLGLADEYDLVNTSIGAPVQEWSIMAAGSWVGAVRGTEPSSFSPLAREQLQDSLGGNWLNQTELQSTELNEIPLQVVLNSATSHSSGVNQLKINLPPSTQEFKLPNSGRYLYYSGNDSNRQAKISLATTLPQSNALTLSMYAQWAMELDYDYAQVLVNGTPLSNPQTEQSSGLIPNVINYISGSSPLDEWQILRFDLNAFSGQAVTIEIIYTTDAAINEFGLVVDDIEIHAGTEGIFSDNAESINTNTLTHFKRITKDLPQKPINYYLQYRTIDDIDAGLSTHNYEPGLLVWLADSNYDDNNASEHPGHGFLSVIDADQHRIGEQNTSVQLRDAAFSLLDQQEFLADFHLQGQSTFEDANDYSSPLQPQSGVILPVHNITFEVIAQAPDSVTVELRREPFNLAAEFDSNVTDKQVQYSSVLSHAQGPVTYLWTFGDGNSSTIANPSHLYNNYGSYEVSLTVSDEAAQTATVTESVVVGPPLIFQAVASSNVMEANLSISIGSGVAPFNLNIDFGDGHNQEQSLDSLQEVTVEHDYELTADYAVTITVTDALGQTSAKEVKLVINSGLNASFSHSTQGLVANFIADIAGGIGEKTILWNFGDGATSQTLNPSHNYASDGSYDVELTVTDESGLSVTFSKAIGIKNTQATVSEDASSKQSSGGALGWLALACLLIQLMRMRISDSK